MTDRELDAAIAEKVMGWDVAGWGDRRLYRDIIPDAKGNRDNPSATITGELPHFSTDRNAAALVLGRIEEMGKWEAFVLAAYYIWELYT